MSNDRFFIENVINYLEGSLDAETAATMQRLIESDSSCAHEYASLKQVCVDLEHLGSTWAKHVPAVDVVNQVLAEIMALKKKPVITPLPERRVPTWAGAFQWAGLASAAVLAILFAVTYRGKAPSDTGLAASRPPAVSKPGQSQSREPRTPRADRPATRQQERRLEQMMAKLPVRQQDEPSGTRTSFDHADSAMLTLGDILNTFKTAPSKDEAFARLSEMASLTEEQARAILASDTASFGAKQAAAAALPKDEAAAQLLALIDEMKGSTDNSDANKNALQYALAQASGDWSDFDPGNALPLYPQAVGMLQVAVSENTDPRAGLDLLAQAAERPLATAYSLDAAITGEEALIAAGVAPDVAAVVESATIGADSYDDLTQIADELLSIGLAFAAQGDYETARLIYEAAFTLGSQLGGSTTSAREQLAGFDIQRLAIDLLQEVYASSGTEADLARLTEQATALLASMENVAGYLDAVDSSLFGPITPESLREIAAAILQYGDIFFLGAGRQ